MPVPSVALIATAAINGTDTAIFSISELTDFIAFIASSRCFIAINESSFSSSAIVRILSSSPSVSIRCAIFFVVGRNLNV